MAGKKKTSRTKSTARSRKGASRKGAPRKRTTRNSRSTQATHVVVRGSRRPAVRAARRVADVDPKASMAVTLTLNGPPLPDANRLPGKTLTPAQFQKAYGASKEDIDTVTRSLARYGLTVTRATPATRSVEVTGTAEQMEQAFRANLGIYRDATGNEFRDREGTYDVPKELQHIVTGVLGFGQRRVAHRRAVVAKDVVAAPLSPQDIEALYAFPPGTAAGQTVAIAEFGGGFFPEDLTAYCTKHSREVPTVNAISVDAPAYTLKEILALPDKKRKDELDSSIEVMMDVEVIAGLCPAATLNVYFSTFDQKGWVDIFDRMIQDRPVAISVSWGMAEDDPNWTEAALNAINGRLNMAALLGITVCVASGDDGSGDEEGDTRCHVDFPASSPFVLGVGGTMIEGPLGVGSELVWWEKPGQRTPQGGGATGGGVSVIFDRPSWQEVAVTSLNPGSIVGRVVPDVAAIAGDPSYDLIVVGRDMPNGGTSASAPVWASLVARIDAVLPADRRQRFLTPLLYSRVAGEPIGASACNDVTSGNNTSYPRPGRGYAAAVGFDAVSGWGTPRGTTLTALLPKV